MRTHRRGMALAGLTALVAAGCVSTPDLSHLVWYKPDGSRTGFMQDRYECVRQATYPRTFGFGGMMNTTLEVDGVMVENCLAARGYRLVDPATIPPPTQ